MTTMEMTSRIQEKPITWPCDLFSPAPELSRTLPNRDEETTMNSLEDLIEDYIAGRMNSESEKHLLNWLDADPENVRTFVHVTRPRIANDEAQFLLLSVQD